MSFDLAVWYSDTALSAEDAGRFYSCIGHYWTIVRDHPALRAFCRALIAEFPGVLDPAELEQDFTSPSPSQSTSLADLMRQPRSAEPSKPPPPDWSIIASFTGLAMTMSLGTRKDEIGPAIERLAAVHGLIMYNPQADEVALPPQLADQPCVPLPEPLRMLIEEQPENLKVRIWFEDRTLFDAEVTSRQEAHRIARDHTIALNRLAYETEDRRLITSRIAKASPAPSPGSDYVFNLLQEYAKQPRKPKN